jgi:predicted DCC family thiol-disulfide oxidoreductase YuxK
MIGHLKWPTTRGQEALNRLPLCLKLIPFHPMTLLYVLYDAECALCRRCREWLEGEAAWVRLEFISFQEALKDKRFEDLAVLRPDREMVVVADTGEVWQGMSAWVMCLWAVREYRSVAAVLAHPVMMPVARRTVTWLSSHRRALSAWLVPEEKGCAGACGVPATAVGEVGGIPEADRFHGAMARARVRQA